jgi:uncharacterized surface protein with fasciclin (FAS1) repeats
MFRRTVLGLAGAVATLALAGPAAAQDIVAALSATGTHQRLVQALGAAGLAPALQGEGPFTIFAPNETAFGKIEEGGELEQLLADAARLSATLGFHVVEGKLLAADLTEGLTLRTLQGGTITITLAGGPKVNGARIVKADIEASNGVVHVIDTILDPWR